MENPNLTRLVSRKIPAGLLMIAALPLAINAQTSPLLKVEVSPTQQVSILASQVSYGAVLRVLETRLGWKIEIPALADQLKLSYVHVDAKQPEEALEKLLEGSGLGYAFVDRPHSLKVIVIPSGQREAPPKDAAPAPEPPAPAPTPEDNNNPAAGAAVPSLPIPTQMQTVTVNLPPDINAAQQGALEQPSAPSTMPLSEAMDTIGAPPGMPPSDAGKATTVPVSDAARIMGVPPGVAPGDVGKTITLPLPTGAPKRP
jgi:hypothetical protein